MTGTWGESFTFPQVPTPHIDVEHRHGGAPLEGRVLTIKHGVESEIVYDGAHEP